MWDWHLVTVLEQDIVIVFLPNRFCDFLISKFKLQARHVIISFEGSMAQWQPLQHRWLSAYASIFLSLDVLLTFVSPNACPREVCHGSSGEGKVLHEGQF